MGNVKMCETPDAIVPESMQAKTSSEHLIE
jgi:hypothetical protein